MISCNKEKAQIAEKDKLASVTMQIMNTHEYYDLMSTVKAYSYEIKSNYLKLSPTDRINFRNVLSEIQAQKDQDSKENLLKSASSIIQIDLLNRLNFIQSKALILLNTKELCAIDKSMLITVISKTYQLTQNNDNLKSAPIQPNQVEYDPCEDLCYANFIYELMPCVLLPPPLDAGCAAVAIIWYTNCVSNCAGN